jgi:drug/metabolite transporter (DMT)-like permease
MTTPEATPGTAPDLPPAAASPLSRSARLTQAFEAWLPPAAQAVFFVSLGSFMLVVMAAAVKSMGDRIPSFELLFFRSGIGLLFVLPIFIRNPLEPLRTKRPFLHLTRGALGAVGNGCFFWTITHMLLADSMALQFSRPLFMIPLAIFFLGERVPMSRTLVSIVGFMGILLYARPFTSGFDANALVGATGAMFGGLVVVSIKKLAKTEPTRVIMFYYAFWNAIIALIPSLFIWVQPEGWEWAMLTLVGFLGISGQGLITKGLTLGDASALAPLDYSRIVYAAVLGFVLFGEIPGVWSFAGMAIIVAASIYLVMTEKKRAA